MVTADLVMVSGSPECEAGVQLRLVMYHFCYILNSVNLSVVSEEIRQSWVAWFLGQKSHPEHCVCLPDCRTRACALFFVFAFDEDRAVLSLWCVAK